MATKFFSGRNGIQKYEQEVMKTPYGNVRCNIHSDGYVRFDCADIMHMVMDEFSEYLNDEAMMSLSIMDLEEYIDDFDEYYRNEVKRARAVMKALQTLEKQLKK